MQKVLLVLGETNLPQNKDYTGNKCLAQAMYEATTALFPEANIAILSAAIADYTPVEPQKSKIKKTGDLLVINLQKTLRHFGYLGQGNKKGDAVSGLCPRKRITKKKTPAKNYKTKTSTLSFLTRCCLKGAGFRHDTNKIYYRQRKQ